MDLHNDSCADNCKDATQWLASTRNRNDHPIIPRPPLIAKYLPITSVHDFERDAEGRLKSKVAGVIDSLKALTSKLIPEKEIPSLRQRRRRL